MLTGEDREAGVSLNAILIPAFVHAVLYWVLRYIVARYNGTRLYNLAPSSKTCIRHLKISIQPGASDWRMKQWSSVIVSGVNILVPGGSGQHFAHRLWNQLSWRKNVCICLFVEICPRHLNWQDAVISPGNGVAPSICVTMLQWFTGETKVYCFKECENNAFVRRIVNADDLSCEFDKLARKCI